MTTTRVEVDDPVLQKYKNGIYIRMLFEGEQLFRELKQLDTNIKILEEKNIKNAEELKKYFDFGKDEQAQLLENFKLRPATAIAENVPIKPFFEDGVGFLIDSTALAAYFFKDNIQSSSIANKHYSLVRPLGVKNVGTFENLFMKLKEQEQSRVGERLVNYNRNFGEPWLRHNEVLLSYGYQDIIGFVLLGNINIESVVNFRNTILERNNQAGISKNIYFYRYDIFRGKLKVIAESTINEYLKEKIVSIGPPLPSPPYEIWGNYLNSLTEAIRIRKFKSITSSLAEHFPPSKEYPIKYNFQVEDQKNLNQTLKGEAFFERGIPLLKIKNSVVRDRNFISHIATHHQRNLVTQCKTILSSDEIKAILKVKWIDLQLIESWGKYSLELSYLPDSIQDHHYKNVLNSIGYPDFCKSKVIMETAEIIKIQLSILQALDPMLKELKNIEHLSATHRAQKRIKLA